MKTTLRYLSLNAQATWHRQVEEQLQHLHSLAAITAAEVVLEHQREAKPAFRVQVRLEVPGPGVHAKATRHTRQAALSFPSDKATASGRHPERAEAHLRSTQVVNGYRLQASDGTIGHVCDFMMDDQSWAIGQLIIKTGHRFSNKEVEIATSKVERISWDESTVFISLTKEAVEQSPAHHLAPVGAAD